MSPVGMDGHSSIERYCLTSQHNTVELREKWSSVHTVSGAETKQGRTSMFIVEYWFKYELVRTSIVEYRFKATAPGLRQHQQGNQQGM